MTNLTWGRDALTPLPTPEPHLRRLTLADAAQCTALSRAVGWGQDERRWQAIINWGGRSAWGIERSGQIIATAIAVCYGKARAWIGMVITHPDHQGNGYARRLMQTALDFLSQEGVRHTLLDATDFGLPLYEKLGFRRLYRMGVWTGRASDFLGPRARPLRSADLPVAIAFDAEVFGVARARVIRRLAQDHPHQGWIDDESGTVDGFALAQLSGDQLHVGPWMARSPYSAEKLLRSAFGSNPGLQVRIDAPEANTGAGVLLRQYNLSVSRYCTRMIYGSPDPPGGLSAWEYGVASFATG